MGPLNNFHLKHSVHEVCCYNNKLCLKVKVRPTRRAAPPCSCDAPRADSAGGTGSNRLRHAASVRSRTIMKNPPSAGAAADAHDSHRRHRAFLPRLTEQRSADRWLDALDQRLVSLNGEENGTDLFQCLSGAAWHTDAECVIQRRVSACCMRRTRLTGAELRRRVAVFWLVVRR